MPDNLYKRKGVWYARVKVHGKDQRTSLRTGVKSEARRRLRKILDDVDHLRFTGEERHSWKTAVVEWAEAIKGSVKPSVLARYLISLNNVREVMDELNVEAINTKTIAEIVRTRRAAGVTNATIKRDLTAVSSVLVYCCAQGWREDNPAKAYDRAVVKERTHVIRLPDEADIEAFIQFCPPMFRRIERLAQYTGLRQNELATLEWPQYRNKTLDLWKTKSDSPRAVPCDERAAGTIEGTPRRLNCPWVFWHDDGQPFVIKSQHRDLMARAVAGGVIKRRYRFHDLRHWYAVDYLRRGGTVYDLQQILGHKSITTTERYLKFLTPEQQRVAKYGKSALVAQTGHKYTGSAHPTDTEDAG